MDITNMASLSEKYPLEHIKPLKKTLSSFHILILFSLGFIISFTVEEIDFVWISGNIVISFFCVVFLLFAIKYIYEIYYLKYYFYDLVGKNLIIRKGVFSRNEITLPINRLQDVYVDQDVLDRIFGLYDVHVSSATVISGNLSHIDGLNKKNSESIKKLILSGIHK